LGFARKIHTSRDVKHRGRFRVASRILCLRAVTSGRLRLAVSGTGKCSIYLDAVSHSCRKFYPFLLVHAAHNWVRFSYDRVCCIPDCERSACNPCRLFGRLDKQIGMGALVKVLRPASDRINIGTRRPHLGEVGKAAPRDLTI